jgi:hypothetical protein
MPTSEENDDEIDELTEFREQDYEQRIAAYKASLGLTDNDDTTQSQREKELAKVLVPLLAMQCYHLPGNNWLQDLVQYVANNHPIFGICFHHRLHPLGAKTRVVALIGTLVFGLALTSFFELLYTKYPRYQRTLVAFGDSEDSWELTSGMLSLWTVGGGIHTAYNLFVWHIAACSCMREGGRMASSKFCHCPNFGKTFLRMFTIVIVALTLFVVCLKVIIANDDSADVEDVANLDNYKSGDDFGFVLAYFVGMVLSFFLWYFVGLLILFSGVLGCYKLPVLGGRPREIAIEKRLNEKMNTTVETLTDVEQPTSNRSMLSKKSSSSPPSNLSKKSSSSPTSNRSKLSKKSSSSSRRNKRNSGRLNSSRLNFSPE